MKVIYLLREHFRYEGHNVIRAFEDALLAYRLEAEINAYEKTKPIVPARNAAREDWDKHHANSESWRENHPLGEDLGGDYYDIQEIEVSNDSN